MSHSLHRYEGASRYHLLTKHSERQVRRNKEERTIRAHTRCSVGAVQAGEGAGPVRAAADQYGALPARYSSKRDPCGQLALPCMYIERSSVVAWL